MFTIPSASASVGAAEKLTGFSARRAFTLESTTITASSQVLFLGELPFWHKISQSILDAPGASFLVRRSASLREALRLLEGGDWHALLVDFSHPAAQELLAAQKLRGSAASIPVVALL